MIATRCAICETLDDADEVYAARCGEPDLNAAVFSARRRPDRIHYRMVRCRRCGLLRSDPVAEPDRLAELYKRSRFDYAAEIENLRRTYSRYLARVATRGRYLEIGCGNGFMIEAALQMGFSDAVGVEPSADAVSKASAPVRSRLVQDTFRRNLFAGASFDVVAMFQVFDHLSEPGAALGECWRVLAEGGFALLLQHDALSWSARVLGERSPIVDIEHTYLYSADTLAALARKHGFRPRETGRVRNRYSVEYVARLARIHLPVRWPVWVPLGNFYMILEKT